MPPEFAPPSTACSKQLELPSNYNADQFATALRKIHELLR